MKRVVQSDYMHWAKTRPHGRYALAASEVWTTAGFVCACFPIVLGTVVRTGQGTPASGIPAYIFWSSKRA